MSPLIIRSGRPKFLPPPTKTDIVIEAIALVGLLLIIAIIIYGVISLPDRVPTHVGPSGGIDSYGSKWQLVTVFFIASAFLYALLTVINRYPYYFNYPAIVTEENGSGLYRIGRSLLRWMKATVMWMFAAMAFWFIIVLPYNPGQSTASLFIMLPFIVLMAVELGYFTIKLVNEGRRPGTE